jgi:hypothetical protein
MTVVPMLAHHPADWVWLAVPIVLVLAWIRWAEHRSRSRHTGGGPAGASNIADDLERDGSGDAR